MCGIAAVFKHAGTAVPPGVVQRMRDAAAHRGPDDIGVAYLADDGAELLKPDSAEKGWTVGLGHRRLSILDLSSAGHQPMTYAGRYWIVYNGEIYNYLELRTALQSAGHRFRSDSDTEVILAAYAEWGPDCFRRLRGMWGIVIVDVARQEVVLSRDRLGIKPLYMWRGGGFFAVASEIKQFFELPGFRPRLDRVVAAEYLRAGYERVDRTFFEDVVPVGAGTYQKVSLQTLVLNPAAPFWFPERIRPVIRDSAEAGRLFAERLQESVKLHLRSDVPVGCALSGGLDSSSIAALVHRMGACSGSILHTFTSTFPGEPTDEREFVDVMTDSMQAEPHFVTPSPESFNADLDRFVWSHDEPVGSLSNYAGYCIARLTREQGVPVTLNGQGGDEVLSGYWQSYLLHLRGLVRRGRPWSAISHIAGAMTGSGNPDLLRQIPVMLRRYRSQGTPSVRVRFSADSDQDSGGVLREILSLDPQGQRVHQIRSMFLPRLLKWDDRNSMAFGVEGRYPFLDHELIELCLAFSPDTLYRRGWTKWPLRAGLRDVLPPRVRDRRSKMGFEAPQDRWLGGAMRPLLTRWLKAERPLWDMVERADVAALAERTWKAAGRREEPGQALFRLFVFDRWSELFAVR